MVITTTEEEVQSIRKKYTAPAPDSSNITVCTENGIATIVFGGSELVIPVAALPALTALTATVGAAIDPIPAPEEGPFVPSLDSPDEPEATTVEA
jgi:hypothetical protein